mgnify:CR=1 FL=1
MKIIGGHDYYDGAGFGVDESVVFLRKAQTFEGTPLTLPGLIGSSYDTRKPALRFFRILVGGEVFPGVREYTPDYNERDATGRLRRVYPEDRLHFDVQSALEALERLEEAGAHTRFFLDRIQPKERITRFFEKTEAPEWTDWMIENRVVVGYNHRPRSDRESSKNVVEANISTLKELEAFRAIDPATAHMRIANWIGGVLPHGPDPVEISDLSRIRKAGFDTVSSFRTPKGAKKPRRKKA